MWDMLESHERVPPQAPKWISQKIQDWLIQDWPRLSLLGNFYWKYAVCASLKVSNRFFHSPYLHSSFFGKSRQQEQDTLPPANSGWEYQAPTLIQTWFNLFFCAVHLFSAAYLKDLSCHWRERERDRETESSGIQIRIKKNTNKKLWRNYHFGKKKKLWHLHFQQWRWTWNLPCFSLHFVPLRPYAGLLNPPWSLQTARWSCEDHPEHPVPYSWKKKRRLAWEISSTRFPRGKYGKSCWVLVGVYGMISKHPTKW